jgi:D-aminopeptidase
MTNGSGDYVIAFSTAAAVRRTPERRSGLASVLSVPNDRMTPLFLAAVEATEEAVYNALFRARTTTGFGGRTVKALPIDEVMSILRRRGALSSQQ